MPNQQVQPVLFSLVRQTGSFLGRIPFPVYLGGAVVVATWIMYNPTFAVLLGIGGGIYAFSKRHTFSGDSSDIPNYFGKARFARYSDLASGTNSFLLGEHSETSNFLNQHFLLGYYVYPAKKRFVSNLLGFKGEGHVLTVAPTGAGKGVSVVIPNLLNYRDSTVVIDIKGENFLRTVYRREHDFANEIYLIDPFGVVEHKVQGLIQQLNWVKQNPGAYLPKSSTSILNSLLSFLKGQRNSISQQASLGNLVSDIDQSIKYFNQLAVDVSAKKNGRYVRGINPLQIIKELVAANRLDEIIDEARAVADMLVIREPGEKEPHWNDRATALLTLIILFLIFSERCNKERHTKYPINLGSVDLLISQNFRSSDSIKVFRNECNAHPILERYVQGIGMEERELSGVLATVDRHLSPLRSPAAQFSLNPSKTNVAQLNDLRVKAKTIYLVLPPDLLTAYRNLSRLWVGSIFRSLYNKNSHMGSKRVFFMLDEVAQLGRLDPLLQAITLGRGYGINVWMIFQSISQLKKIYDQDWSTVLANVQFSQLFGLGASDLETQEYVSKICGQKTIEIFTESVSSSQGQNYSVNSGYSSSSSSDGKGGGSSGSSSSSGTSRGWSTTQTESMSNQYQSRNLLNTDEAVRLTQTRHLILGTPFPTDAVPMKYYEIRLFANRYPVTLPPQLMQQLEL